MQTVGSPNSMQACLSKADHMAIPCRNVPAAGPVGALLPQAPTHMAGCGQLARRCCHACRPQTLLSSPTCEGCDVGLHVNQADQAHRHASPQAVPLGSCDVFCRETLCQTVQLHEGWHQLQALLDVFVLAAVPQHSLCEVQQVLQQP